MLVVLRCEVVVVGGFVGRVAAFNLTVERTESRNADANHGNGEFGVGPDYRLGCVVWILLVPRRGEESIEVTHKDNLLSCSGHRDRWFE